MYEFSISGWIDVKGAFSLAIWCWLYAISNEQTKISFLPYFLLPT